MTFQAFPKIPRLSREMIITEKIDGTNACIFIEQVGLYEDTCKRDFPISYAKGTTIAEGGENPITFCIYSQSRNKIITPTDDNAGFAKFVRDNGEELLKLGEGYHYGEWWGQGIQRGYGLKEKRFSLFNVSRWTDDVRPACCRVVPTLYTGLFDTETINKCLDDLTTQGSYAEPGWMKPEGIVIYHVPSGYLFKKTIEKDESPKGQQ